MKQEQDERLRFELALKEEQYERLRLELALKQEQDERVGLNSVWYRARFALLMFNGTRGGEEKGRGREGKGESKGVGSILSSKKHCK